MTATFIRAGYDAFGFHKWHSPTDHRKYLGLYHRHNFTVNVEVEQVFDRQVEFHDLKDYIEQSVQHWAMNKESYLDSFDIDEFYQTTGQVDDEENGRFTLVIESCESFAQWLHSAVTEKFGMGAVNVEVWEDGEFAAIVRST